MGTRSCGTTGLRCSEIGFGTWALGSNWWGTGTSGEGVDLIRRAVDLGITFFGTADGDLSQLHNPRMDAIARADLFEELERLRDEGKLRHYGVALGPAIGWR